MSKINQYMVKFVRVVFFVIIFLLCSQHSFCEENETRVNKKPRDQEYKSYINEFQSGFGKKMEREFNLTLIEGGFLRRFPIDTIEFYAYRRATLEEARALALSLLNRLDWEIRADPELLFYLSLIPRPMGINIHFVNLEGWSYEDGSIDNVYSNYAKSDKNDFQKRYLAYTTTDPFSDYSAYNEKDFSTKFEESFEDAVNRNSATSSINPSIHEPMEFENELNQILTSFKKEMKEKYGFLFHSSGWMVAGKTTSNVSEICTKCKYLYPAHYREARAYMLLATEKLLTALNNSEALRPYLIEYPFPASRLKLRMLFRQEKCFVGNVPYEDGSMESVVLNGNVITYYHYIPNIKDSSMNDRVVYAKESYQEALNTPPLTSLEKMTKKIENYFFDFSRILDYLIYMFSMLLLFVIFTNNWLYITLIIIIFILLRRWYRSRQN